MRVIVLASALLFAVLASARGQQAMPACDGDFAIVRVARVRPGGSLQGLVAAAAAHQAWYRANGVTDNDIVVSRVVTADPATGTVRYSDTEVLTYHIRPPAPPRTPNRGNAEWNGYVKQYQDNSEIVSEYLTCLPRAVRQ